MKTILLAAPFLLATSAHAQSITFPASSGVLNVRDAKYGARGDGKTDDTAAIQKALTEALSTHRVIYLPDGTYLVSDTLKWQNAADAGNKVQGWGPFLQLQGQSRARTIIRLRDSAAGFGDEDAPKAVIQTGSSGAHGGKTYRNGEGNEAFENHLRDFSVQTGSGNAGAIGIDFQASNCGAMRHVSISGAGYAGISLARRDNGPALLKDISVQGFRFGIRTSQEIAHFTLEDIQLRNQTEAGIWMRDSVVAARHISSQSAAPAIQMAGTSLLALFDSNLKGEGAAAIACQGSEPRLFVRNLATSGYAASVRARGESQKPILSEWSSDAPVGAGVAGGKLSLGLAIRDTPEWYEADPSRWADAGAPSGGDDTAQVQAAFDSGKAFVMFRAGRYRVSQTLVVPPTVRRLQGVGSILQTTKKLDDGQPLLRLAGGAAANLTIVDRFELGSSDGLLFEHAYPKSKEIGAGHLEIWFNEGWAYTNTAQDEPAVALTNLNSAQSTNAMVDSIAELSVNGQEKTILFHSAYEEHGQSFWDYAGPGQMLWDFNGYPLPLVAAWNTLSHHIGLSKAVAWVRPPGANFCIFQDERNARGVCVAYADREAKADVQVLVPFPNAIVEDCMGNAAPLRGQTLTLSKSGRPVFLYTSSKASGPTLAARLLPLDRKNAGFVSRGGASFRLPAAWEGSKAGTSEGNSVLLNGRPLWKLSQIWPPEPSKPENYRPLIWRDNFWKAPSDDVGDQPKIELRDNALRIEFRAAAGTPQAERIAGLSFVAPSKGTYALSASAELKLWDGEARVRLQVLRKSKTGAIEVVSLPLKRDARVSVEAQVLLDAGDELVLVPRPEGAFTGGDVTLCDLDILLGAGGAAAYKLPQSWSGEVGNPIRAGGRGLWRVDQVWPDDPSIASHYTPLKWSGTEWAAAHNGMGGQPAVRVEDGAFKAAVRGSWTGAEGQRIAGLVFMAPRNGVYRVTGSARSKPWEGGAASYRLGVWKKDTQRATNERSFDLPRSGEAVAVDFTIELSAGHELVLLPQMPDWHNATSTTIENLTIREEKN